MSKKILRSLLLLITVSFLTSSLQLIEGQTELVWEVKQVGNNNLTSVDNESNLMIQPIPKLITHEPISIYTEQNFTDYGFPGNGSETNPYRVENLEITTAENDAIAIYNISVHFIISNCQVSANRYGIFIYNSSISNNEISNNQTIATISNNLCMDSWRGIFVLNSWRTNVINNTCLNNEREGIRIEDSWFSIGANNTCKFNENGFILITSSSSILNHNLCLINDYAGLIIWSSQIKASNNTCISNTRGIELILAFSIITLNNCSYNVDAGIALRGSSYSTITNNTCAKNKYGIHNKDSFHVIIKENTCINNEFGIFLTVGSWYDRIKYNICLKNSEFGIYLEKSKECEVQYNLLQNNGRYGVYLNQSANTTIVAYNSFIENNLGGNSQGYDSGVENIWYDEENEKGNYWSDLQKRKYCIDGFANSIDSYPLNELLEREVFFPFFYILISIFLVSILTHKKRKRKQAN